MSRFALTQEQADRIKSLLPPPLDDDFEPQFYDPGRHARRQDEALSRHISQLYLHIARLEDLLDK